MKKQMIAIGLTGLILAGCAGGPTPQLSPIQPGDAQMSCIEKETQMANLYPFINNARTGGNGASTAGKILEGIGGFAGGVLRNAPGGALFGGVAEAVTGLLGDAVTAIGNGLSSHDEAAVASAIQRYKMLKASYEANCIRNARK